MVRNRNRCAIAAAAARAVSSRVRWLAAVGALGCAMGVPTLPPRAEIPAWFNCFSERKGTQTVEEYAKLLSPAEGASVVAGTPVTFFARGGGGESPMTFMVASSPALLSSPDIDSGLGTLLPPGYKTELLPPEDNPEDWLTSTKASATPRTIYWTASFTRNLRSCDEPPVTFTLPTRTLTVMPSPAEEQAAAKQKQEEEAAAAKRKKEAEAAATPTGSVSLDGSTITVRGGGEAQVKLACAGTGACVGKLTLTGRGIAKQGRRDRAKAQSIATASYSIPAGKTATIQLTLNASGRALLSAAHGHLGAIPMLLKSSPAPSQTHTENVQLVRQKKAKRGKRK